MKQVLPKIIFLILVIGLIFGGKYVIDHKTYDYRKEVTDSLTKYFINGDTEDLEPIVKLLNTYVEDEEYRKDVQVYSADFIGSWFLYIDGKYYCSLGNKNSCVAQYKELDSLNKRLTALYEYKADDGYTIIVPSAYNNLTNEAASKLTALNNIINSSSARDPQNIEQIRTKKCQLTNECENCREGMCTCYYTDSDSKTRETLTCYGKVTNNGY